MQKALIELKSNNLDLTNVVNDYVKDSKTFIKENVLHYKNINEGLFYLVHHKHNKKLELTNNFETFGTMLDLSRAAAFNLTYIKDLIRKQALMGVNEVWLYIEDMYELKEYPQFGYLRGRYTEEELIEIVSYANLFDIKVVPSMQTLGHMEQFLRWAKSRTMKDQPTVLMARSDETFTLIDTMFKQLKKIFKHDKIHIGLDETWGFGLGTFFKKNGFTPQIELFFEHLNKVNDLALKNGFKEVLMWSDMPYRILSKMNSYYDLNITIDESVMNQIPDNVTLVYWDYYNRNRDTVDKMLKNHKEMTDKVVFASGTWIWTRFNYDKSQTDATAPVHIEASINNNIKEFILTQWMDDGAYGDHETTLLGVYEMSLKANTKNDVCSKTYEFITNEPINVSLNKTKLNDTKLSQVGLMWDDPQYAIYLSSFVQNDLDKYNDHLLELEQLLTLYKDDKAYDYEHSIIAANYYKIKGRQTLISQYKNNETIAIDMFFNEQIKHLRNLLKIFRNRWYNKHKMYGLEIIQSRIATQIIRAEEMIELAKLYNNKEINNIDGLLDEVASVEGEVYPKHSLVAFTTMPI